MALSNCTKCGSLFSRVNKPVCPKCVQKEEADFGKATDWMRENPGQTIHHLSEDTGIDKGDILRWIREKRLMMGDMSGFVNCRRCGVPISNGNFCEDCREGLSQKMGDGLRTIDTEKTSPHRSPSGKGMHYHRSERGRKGSG